MNDDTYRLPADEEEYLIKEVHTLSWVRRFYRFGWMKGKIWAVNQILGFLEITGEPKEKYKKLIEYILDLHHPSKQKSGK